MPEPIMDVFNGDAFSIVNLTDAINKLDFVPGRVGEMGLFQEDGVTTTTIAIEEKGGILQLVKPTPRGGPGDTLDKEKRTMRDIKVPHFEINDAIMAEEVQGVRAFGSGNTLESLLSRVTARLGQHSQSHAATQEYSRIGGMKGIITYADGSVLNLFDVFEVNQLAEVDFDLDNGAPVDGILRKKCAGVIRSVGKELGGAPSNGGLWAFCGDDFFDLLLQHKEVRDTFKGWTDAQILRDGYVGPHAKSWGMFSFGGIVWENYRGSVGGTDFINSHKTHIFPMGVPGLFKTAYAPADYEETVNTMGLPRYARQYPMPNGKGRHLDTQMNGLEYCTRPRVLVLGKDT